MAVDVGTGFVDILPRTDKFTSLLTSQLSGATAAFGALGVAAGAALGVSVKLASDFEDSMARIQGLVGISSGAVENLTNHVLDLAKTVPVGPTELADALFFVESAGLRGKDAMDALTASAKASAAGLGDTKTIADVVTSALNSYAGSGLTAAHATDILVAAVREGKLPPADLAAALGQVLPVASQVGVTFDQVAAAIASATRQGLSASRAATGVRFLLTSFIKPSEQAVEVLDQFGFSIAGVQKSLEQRGLLATLQTLAKRFDLSSAAGKQAFATVVGGARGLATAAILVGKNGAAIEDVFNHIADSAGSTDEAFRVASETLSFKFKQLVNDLTIVAIHVGTALIPILKSMADTLVTLSPLIEGLGKLFTDLIAPMQDAARGAQALAQRLGDLVGPIKNFISLIGQLTATDTGGWVDSFTSRFRSGFTSGFWDSVIGPGNKVLDFLRSVPDDADAAGGTIEQFGHNLRSLGGDLVELRNKAKGPARSLIDLGIATATANGYGKLFSKGLDDVGKHVDKAGKIVQNFAGLTTNELSDWRDSVSGDIQGVITDLSQLESVFQTTPAELQKAFTRMTKDALRWNRDMAALLALKPGTLGLSASDTQAFEKFLIDQGPQFVDAFVRATEDGRARMVGEWQKTEGAINSADSKVNKLTSDLKQIPPKVSTDVKVNGIDQATLGVTTLKNILNGINGKTYSANIVVSEIRRGFGPEGNPVTGQAKGGIVAGASGFVTSGPTLLVGEGHNATPFGKGKEAVIPFDRGGQTILDRAMGAALERVLGKHQPAAQTQPVRLIGEMRMADWKQGLVDLDGQLDWERLARSS